MKRALIAASGLVLLLLVACTSGDSTGPAAREEADQATEAVVEEPDGAPQAVDEAPQATVEPPDEPSDGLSALSEGFGPLGLLTGSFLGGEEADLGFASGSEDVDPRLKEVLIREEDLPPGFSGFGMGGFSFSFPSDEGSMQMAMSMFFEGSIELGEAGSIVMSAVVQTPEPVPLEEFSEGLDEFGSLGELDDETLQELLGESGVEFRDVRLLDASGLGDAGFGVHMVMSVEGFSPEEAFADNPFGDEIALDLYMSIRGDKMLMVVVMWPVGAAASVDGRALAELMDERAQEAF